MLENWLKKVNSSITDELSSFPQESLGQGIKIHSQEFPDLEDCQVVLISDSSTHMDQIRLQFYEMYNHFQNICIADLGDLRNTDENLLINLFSELIESKVIPIIFTSNQQVIHSFHFALNTFHNKFTSLNCAKNIAPYSKEDYANCEGVMSMGIQGHLNPKSSLSLSNEIIRISDIKNQIQEGEPHTRIVDTILFNLNIIRHSEIPGYKDASPSGLTSEEATQLFRYFGFNDKLKALFITSYDSQEDFNMQTAQLIAQGIWYFLEAKDQCITENINSIEDFNEFVVDIEGLSEPLSFIKAKRSGRWWIKSKETSKLIPCSYQDYLTACKNEIPEKLLS